MQCAHCAHANADDARFCGSCGAGLTLSCAGCGAARTAEQRFCPACGAAHGASAARADAPGERRQATVMFSDLSGYTALNEALDPEEVEAAMARVKSAAVTVVERFGGSVNQFVGDEIMALFGLPLARRDDACRAVRAALELHRAVDAISAGLQAQLGGALGLHTGIATGLVVARRSDARAGEFTLTGDTVNTAARLRSLAATGEVVVSHPTWQQVTGLFETDAGTAVEIRGKELPVVAYRVKREREAGEVGAAAIVGRDDEVQQFLVLAQACRERAKGRVVLVRGDPGVGKSRLVAEFISAARGQGFECHVASVLDFGAQTGRDAVRSLARSLLGLSATADEVTRREAVERAVAKQPVAAERELALHDLADVAPPAALRTLLAAMSVASRDSGSMQALCALTAQACARAPVLLQVDDIHWADAWTLERLAALAAMARSHAMLLVMTTRFAGDPSAGAWRTALHGAPVMSFDLGPLQPDDALRMATRNSGAPDAVLRSCVARAEGNPLFLEQLLLNAGELVEATLPGSIQALVHARLDRLAPSDKLMLQAASVLGQRFSLDALRHLSDNPACDCRPLVEHFLVRPDGDEFLFCHALIRDGAYASLLHSNQRQLHLRAALWFESRDAVLAAEHFDRAADARAPLACLTAGNALAAQYRFEPALALVTRGLALASEHPAQFALLMAQTRLLVELGRPSEAIECSRNAVAVAQGPAERARALIELAAGMRLKDLITDGLAALAEAQPLVEQAGLVVERARLHHMRANLLFPLGRADECLHEHQQALACAEQAGLLEAQATALGGLGDAYYLKGWMRRSHEQFLRCVALAREHGLLRLEVSVLSMVGWTALYLNDVRGAVDVAHEAVALAVRAAQPRAELMSRALVVELEGLLRGDVDAAAQQLSLALPLARALGAKRFEAQLLGCAAVLAHGRSEPDLARAHAAAALDICRAHGMGHIGPYILGVNALVAADPAARADALAQGEAQLALGCVSHNHISLRRIAIDVLLEAGDWSAVETHCAALDAYTSQDPLPHCDFIATRGRALARLGRGERAPQLLTTFTGLRDEAVACDLNFALPGINAALAAFRAAPG